MNKSLLIILILFNLQCERGWIREVINPTVLGCTSIYACNYNVQANEDDGNCDFSSCIDCLGYPQGIATLDSCGTCDAAPQNDCVKDCSGEWGGVAVIDKCGNCDADKISCELDCAGIWGGKAIVDNCNVCGGNDSSCKDCNGDINGTAYIDGCNICVGGNTGLFACETGTDCAGILAGTSYYDNCGKCVLVEDTSCIQGCDGIWLNDGTQKVYDKCNICGGNGTACQDCLGVINGTAIIDMCGICDSDPNNNCIQDCAGIWGGTSVLDNCGVCGGINAGCTDCLGVIGGGATVDNCGICNGNNSCIDCSGTPYGIAYTDMCDICDDNPDNDCIQDCNGIWGGNLIIDECGICGGDGSSCSTKIQDFDENYYETVQIGSQIWMSENLRTAHYNNGDAILFISNFENWGSYDQGQYAIYKNESSNGLTYGFLYNWAAVNDNRGICPFGYHIPSDDDFKLLEIYLGMSSEAADSIGGMGMISRGEDEGSKLAGNLDLWNDGELEGNSNFGISGFNALPGGYHAINSSIETNCSSGTVNDCSGDGDCCDESWIGDGFADCTNQQWACDLTCYDCDGGDCGSDCNNNISAYRGLGDQSYFVSSTEYNMNEYDGLNENQYRVWCRHLYSKYPFVQRLNKDKRLGFSVRCVKDN